MKKKFLEIGKIVTTHGVVGEVKVYPWCDTPDFLTGFSSGSSNFLAQKI